MGHVEAYNGNRAMATGVKLCRPKIICSYPITPQTTVVEYLSEFVNNGELDAEYIESEGEHGMLHQALGAAQAGARVFTATSGQGLLYGYEAWPTIAHSRLPIVCGIVNRSCDFTIYPDHTDSMLVRDWAWMQLYVENAQESLDTIIQAYRMAEDKRIYLPALVCQDGFYVSYTTEPVDVPEQVEVDEFLPPFTPVYPALDPSRPSYAGWAAQPEAARIACEEALIRARTNVIKEINEEFGKKFGRKYGNGLIEEYMMEDAEVALVTIGSMSGSAKTAVEEMRGAGKKAGLIRVRSFRPFPLEDFQRLGKQLKAMAICDRNVLQTGTGGVGALFLEVKHALWSLQEKPLLLNFIVGLAGLEVRTDDFKYFLERVLETGETGIVGKEVEWYPQIEIKEIMEWKPAPPEDLARICWPGTTQCQGCGENLIIRTAVEVLGRNTVTLSNVGCGGYSGSSYSRSAISLPEGHTWLPGGVATAAGVSRAFKALGKRGVNVVFFAGDGSYGDMGFMAASGAAERNEDMIVICLDNEAYMNTGGQRSGATPFKARTTTTPVGTVIAGKQAPKKDLPMILAAHHIPYVATASVAFIADFKRKLEKAAKIPGHRYIHVISPCPTGWRILPEDSIRFARLTVQSGIWPLYEIEQGKFRFTYKPKERIPVREALAQGRYSHLTDKDVEEIQKTTNETWATMEEFEKVGTIF